MLQPPEVYLPLDGIRMYLSIEELRHLEHDESCECQRVLCEEKYAKRKPIYHRIESIARYATYISVESTL